VLLRTRVWYSHCAVVVTDHKLGKLEPRCYRARLLGHAIDGYQRFDDLRVGLGYYVRLEDGRELVTQHVCFHEHVPVAFDSHDDVAAPSLRLYDGESTSAPEDDDEDAFLQ